MNVMDIQLRTLFVGIEFRHTFSDGDQMRRLTDRTVAFLLAFKWSTLRWDVRVCSLVAAMIKWEEKRVFRCRDDDEEDPASVVVASGTRNQLQGTAGRKTGSVTLWEREVFRYFLRSLSSSVTSSFVSCRTKSKEFSSPRHLLYGNARKADRKGCEEKKRKEDCMSWCEEEVRRGEKDWMNIRTQLLLLFVLPDFTNLH